MYMEYIYLPTIMGITYFWRGNQNRRVVTQLQSIISGPTFLMLTPDS